MHPPAPLRWRIDYIIRESCCTLFLPGQAQRHRRRFRAFERFRRRFLLPPHRQIYQFSQVQPLVRLFRFKIGGCALRLYRYDFCIRRDVFHVRAEPGQESSSPTLAKENAVQRQCHLKFRWQPFLSTMTSGSSNGWINVRFFFTAFRRTLIRIIESVTRQYDFNKFFSEQFHLGYFLSRCG